MIVLIIEILFFIVLVIAGVMSVKLESSYSRICLVLMIIIWCINACCVAVLVNQPTAIDVYKGKTKLQITYKGTIPIDSVVVFKNK